MKSESGKNNVRTDHHENEIK